MKYSWRRGATLEEAKFVLAHLWQRGRHEMELFQVASPEALVEGWLAAGPTWVILREHPVVVTGVEDGWTWFLATEEAEKSHGLTRVCQRVLADMPRPLNCASACLHPAAERWFNALGFEHIGASNGVQLFQIGD